MKKGIFLSILMSISPLLNASDYEIHVLKEGETLSELLQLKGYSPLYGEDKWVEKTLQLNHLKSVNAKELKKGFPVILPHKEVKPLIVNTVPKIRTKTHSHFQTISKHQDVIFGVNFFQTSASLEKTKISQDSNYQLSLGIFGKNNYKFKKLTYNYFGRISTSTTGPGKIENNSLASITLKPTYMLKTGLHLHTELIPFTFGPSIRIQEKSIATQDNDNVSTRRDQTTWIGFEVSKNFKTAGSLLRLNASYEQKAIQSSLTNSKIFEASKMSADLGVHLTKNYAIGLNASSTSYKQITLQEENSLGVNFNYFIK